MVRLKLIIQGDSMNAINWSNERKKPPRKLVMALRAIRKLSRDLDASSRHVKHMADGIVAFLA